MYLLQLQEVLWHCGLLGLTFRFRPVSVSSPCSVSVSRSDIKHNLKERLTLSCAVKESVRSRVRPVVMTAAMAAIGLMPAAVSHGIGSESQRPLAIVIIGGLVGATFFALFVFPLIVEFVYGKMLYDNLKQRSL